MREQIQFLEPPPDEAWEAVSRWLRHHGIDPARLPMTCWIDRCEETRRISYPEILLGVDYAQSPPQTAIVAGTVVRTVQLEAPPSPFPPGLLRDARVNYTCVNNPALAAVLTIPPTWPTTPRFLGSLCGPG